MELMQAVAPLQLLCAPLGIAPYRFSRSAGLQTSPWGLLYSALLVCLMVTFAVWKFGIGIARWYLHSPLPQFISGFVHQALINLLVVSGIILHATVNLPRFAKFIEYITIVDNLLVIDTANFYVKSRRYITMQVLCVVSIYIVYYVQYPIIYSDRTEPYIVNMVGELIAITISYAITLQYINLIFAIRQRLWVFNKRLEDVVCLQSEECSLRVPEISRFHQERRVACHVINVFPIAYKKCDVQTLRSVYTRLYSSSQMVNSIFGFLITIQLMVLFLSVLSTVGHLLYADLSVRMAIVYLINTAVFAVHVLVIAASCHYTGAQDFLSTDRGPWTPGRWPAPDGGWGWLVVLGAGLVFMVTIGPMGSFGLIFGAFLDNIGAGTSDVTFINGLFFALALLPGVLANRVLQLYSCRQVTIVGGLFYFFGCFLSSFSSSVAYMVITFSIIQGTGLGLLMPASFTCINHYFLRRRTCAMGAAQLMAAVGVMLYPLLIETLLEKYGFRGTQAILSALSLNTLVGAMTMKPLDSSALLERRKNFERRIEDQLRRKSIISIRSVRLKTDNDDGRYLSTDDLNEDNKIEEIPLREGPLQFSTNCNTINESILEEAEEEVTSESQPILDGHFQNSNKNKIPALSDDDSLDNGSNPVELTKDVKGTCITNEDAGDFLLSQNENQEPSQAIPSIEISNNVDYFDYRDERLQYIDEIDISDTGHSNESHTEILANGPQCPGNNSSTNQRSYIQTISSTNTPSQSRKELKSNCESDNKHEIQGVGNESGTRDLNPTVLNTSSTPSEKCVQDGCHNSAASTQVCGDTPRESALFTIGGDDVALNVPTIDVLEVPNGVIGTCDNNGTAFIRRSHSANILGHHYYHKDIIIPSVGSYNELSAASSLTAFSRDFPNYKKTYGRSSRSNRNDDQCYPQVIDAKFHAVSGRRENQVFNQREIIKSRSASNILNVRNRNNLGVRQTKLSVAFSDRPSTNAGDRYYSNFYSDIKGRDPHRVHPCFYEGTTALVPAQESLDATEHVTGVVFEDEVSPMKPLLKQSPQAQMSSSFEFLARFPPPLRGDKRRSSAMTTISARSMKELAGDSDSSDSSLCLGSSEESHFRSAARQRKQSVISWTADCLDLELLKDAIYVNIIVGVSFSLFSDNMFFNLQPLYYLSLEFSGPEVALCIAVNSAADLVGRLVFVLCSFCLTYKSRLLFLLASIATIVFRIVFLLTKDYVLICVMTALLGFFRSWINVCIPLIFAEFSPVDRFPAAYGLHLLTAGLVHLLIGPFVGLIRDVSGSYIICLGTVTGCLLFCVIPWIGEALFFRLSAVLKISS